MARRLRILAMAATAAVAPHATPGTEVLDRIVAVVDRDAIVQSEIASDLRWEAMMSGSEVDEGPERQDSVLRRLIDRRLVQMDIATTPFLMASPEEVDGAVAQLHGESFFGDRDFAEALAYYGLDEEECRSFVAEQISFERYVQFRFKSGFEANPDSVQAYYEEEYVPGQRRARATVEPLETIADSIREIIAERRANTLLEDRLNELRASHRIEFLGSSTAESAQ